MRRGDHSEACEGEVGVERAGDTVHLAVALDRPPSPRPGRDGAAFAPASRVWSREAQRSSARPRASKHASVQHQKSAERLRMDDQAMAPYGNSDIHQQ